MGGFGGRLVIESSIGRVVAWPRTDTDITVGTICSGVINIMIDDDNIRNTV